MLIMARARDALRRGVRTHLRTSALRAIAVLEPVRQVLSLRAAAERRDPPLLLR
jgi:hypothetical protein